LNVKKSQANTFKRSKKEIFGKAAIGLVAAQLVYEAILWNNYLAKLYLIQREKLYYS